MSERARMNSEGRTLLRVARELRGFLQHAPAEDEDAQSLLRDADVVEKIGNWLASVVPIEATAGIPTNAGTAPWCGSCGKYAATCEGC